MSVTDKEIAWVAGFYEGEGSTSYTNNTTITMRIGTTDLDVLEKFSKITGAKISLRKANPSQLGTKPMWEAKIYGPTAYAWYMMIFPLLGNRRQEQIKSVVVKWLSRPTNSTKWTPERRARMSEIKKQQHAEGVYKR